MHLILMGCTLAKYARFFREISSFLPFSGNLWGARAPSRCTPLTAPLLKMMYIWGKKIVNFAGVGVFKISKNLVKINYSSSTVWARINCKLVVISSENESKYPNIDILTNKLTFWKSIMAFFAIIEIIELIEMFEHFFKNNR